MRQAATARATCARSRSSAAAPNLAGCNPAIPIVNRRCAGWLCTQLDWPIFFSSAEATSIDVDSFRGDGLHAWVGSSAECVHAWHKFSCAYTYDRCDPVDGSVVKGKDAPSCRSRCENVVR